LACQVEGFPPFLLGTIEELQQFIGGHRIWAWGWVKVAWNHWLALSLCRGCL
jgi:hypothetical protein